MPLWQLPGVDYKRFLNLPIESPGWETLMGHPVKNRPYSCKALP